MANEIQASLSFRATKGGATVSFQDNFRQDMSGSDMVQQTQLIGTGTPEIIDMGEITPDFSQIIIKNLDSANYVLVFKDATETGMGIKIKPGKFAMFCTDGHTIYAKADTASVRILTIATAA